MYTFATWVATSRQVGVLFAGTLSKPMLKKTAFITSSQVFARGAQNDSDEAAQAKKKPLGRLLVKLLLVIWPVLSMDFGKGV